MHNLTSALPLRKLPSVSAKTQHGRVLEIALSIFSLSSSWLNNVKKIVIKIILKNKEENVELFGLLVCSAIDGNYSVFLLLGGGGVLTTQNICTKVFKIN